jgi:Mg2+/Co2+ transporter CorB
LEHIPLWVHVLALLVLLAGSAFFSIAETSMMALNRYRLNSMAKQGRKGAVRTQELLSKTESLLGTILLGNNLINTAMTTLVTALAIKTFGNNDTVLLAATTLVAFFIIVFCEITPKVIGATYPDRIALPASYPLTLLVKLLKPAVVFVNAFVRVLLRIFGIKIDSQEQTKLSNEEIRSIVLESSQLMPNKHRSILLNLFDLEHITVDDVMTPRNRVEALDIEGGPRAVVDQLKTCYHNKLPVYEGELNNVIGILPVKRALALLQEPEMSITKLKEMLSDTYFVPSGTPVFTQLQYFQENKQRVALVVDEYGEVLGLVTLEDIIEEIVGDFTTQAPGNEALDVVWGTTNEVTLDGSAVLRDLNRRLGTKFELDGPRTLNGWIMETLQEIPEGPVSLRHAKYSIEISQFQGRIARSVKLRRL